MPLIESTNEAQVLLAQQVFETDDRVAVFFQVIKGAMEIGVVHMLRYEDGKFSELWDMGQILEKNSPNKNGIF